jgi:nucleoside-diphosphate-sugar epimerase
MASRSQSCGPIQAAVSTRRLACILHWQSTVTLFRHLMRRCGRRWGDSGHPHLAVDGSQRFCLGSGGKVVIWAHTQPTMSHVNVATGVDCTIRELTETMAKVTGYKGALSFDASKPDGTPRKLLNVDLIIVLGWQAKIELESGLAQTYHWYESDDQCRL